MKEECICIYIFMRKMIFIIGFIAMISMTYPTIKGSDNISGELLENSYTYYMEVTDEMSLESFAQMIELRAYDEYDLDITDMIDVRDLNDIEEKVFNCPVSSRTVGVYTLHYTVKDRSNNEAELFVDIIVRDTIPPEIDYEQSILSYEIDIDNIDIQNDDLLNGIVATDSYSLDDLYYQLEGDLSLTNLEKTIDKEQTIRVYVIDQEDNYTEVNVIVVLKDKTPPFLDLGNDPTVRYYDDLSIDDILNTMQITANDNYDSNVSYRVISDSYTQNKSKVGNYSVVIEATDKSGNSTRKTTIVEVIDDIKPSFYGNSTSLVVGNANSLTKDELLRMLIKRNQIRDDEYNVTVLEDEYSNNWKKEGKYKYKIRINYDNEYEDFLFTIKVVNNSKLSFFQTIHLEIKKIGSFILDIIKWPISKIKKLF